MVFSVEGNKISKNFKCTHCDKAFEVNSKLKRHVDEVHLKKIKVTCDKCEKVLGSEATLKNHNEIVHEFKSSSCDICNKVVSKRELRRHFRSHYIA